MAAKIINAKKVMPIHWGAFTLSTHGRDDGPERFVTEAEKQDLCVITPHLPFFDHIWFSFILAYIKVFILADDTVQLGRPKCSFGSDIFTLKWALKV